MAYSSNGRFGDINYKFITRALHLKIGVTDFAS
jgi:hypothetical protein